MFFNPSSAHQQTGKIQQQKPASSALGWICLVFLVWRLINLSFLHPRYFFLWPDEELYRGLLGKLLAEQTPIPILHLFPDNYSTGGALTVGFLTSLVFRVLDPTVFALKLIPLSFSFASLIVWYKLIEKYLNPRVAMLSALLMIFAPSRYIAYSLTAMGDHYESIFLTAITLWFFFRIVLEKKENPLFLIGAGVLAGYSLWFAYIYSLTLMTCLIFLGLHNRPFYRSKNLAPLILGFLIGFSPWFFINTQFFFQGFSVKGVPLWEYFAPQNLLTGFSRFYDFPRSAPGLFFDSFLQDMAHKLLRRLIQLFYIGFLFVPLLAVFFKKYGKTSLTSLWQRTPVFVRWMWIYGVLFLTVIQFSQFRERYYFFPLITVSFILASFYWNRLLSRQTKNKTLLRTLLITSFIVVSLTANISKFSFEHRGKMLSTPGYSYFGAGVSSDFSALSFCKDLSSCCVSFPLLDQPMTQKEVHELGMGATINSVGNTPTNALKTAVPASFCPLIFQKYFYYMLGSEYFLRVNDLQKTLAALEFFKKRSFPIYTMVVRGALSEFSRSAGPSELIDAQLQSAEKILSPSEVRFYWRALSEIRTGQWLSKPKGTHPPLEKFILDFLSQYPEEQHRYLLQGAGRAFLRKAYMKRHPGNFIKQLERLKPIIRKPILEGVGMATLASDLVVSRITLRATLEPVLSQDSMKSVSDGQKLFLDFFKNYSLKTPIGIALTKKQG